jgi:thymidylate synthase
MILADKYYINNLNDILENGTWDENPRPKYKDGEPANSKFISQVFEKYDVSKGEFPITTLRNTAIKTGIREVLWIYQKQTSSLKDANDLKIYWWEDWNIGDGTIGTRYGATIKKYDLMNKQLSNFKNDPFSRRHLINMYQYSDMEETKGLHPCAYETIWTVRKNNDTYLLDLTLIQRSNDYIMAGYINKAQYVALQMMVCGHLRSENMDIYPGNFSHLVQNLHIYNRHFDAVTEILERNPLEQQPSIILKEDKNFYEYTEEDFEIKNIKGISKINSKLEIAI